MITHAQKAALRRCGYTDGGIREMTPAVAHQLLAGLSQAGEGASAVDGADTSAGPISVDGAGYQSDFTMPGADPKPAYKGRFKLTRFADVKLGKHRRQLVRGLLALKGLMTIWGAPKSYKSFWVFDMVMHLALGWPYRGRRVQQGVVVYVACEGGDGFDARIEAFRREHPGADDALFLFMITRLDLAVDASLLAADIQKQLADEGFDNPAIIVMDTLNRSFSGSESSDKDMGDYLKGGERLCDAFNCLVLLVHHCGHDQSRPRGHTALGGAVVGQVAIRSDKATKTSTAEVVWLRDGPGEGDEITSELRVVSLGLDEDGQEITSMVVDAAEVAEVASGAPFGVSDEEVQRRHEERVILLKLHEIGHKTSHSYLLLACSVALNLKEPDKKKKPPPGDPYIAFKNRFTRTHLTGLQGKGLITKHPDGSYEITADGRRTLEMAEVLKFGPVESSRFSSISPSRFSSVHSPPKGGGAN